MRVTGALLVDAYEDIKKDLEFINPFDDSLFKAYIEVDDKILIPRGYPIVGEDYTLDMVDHEASIKLAEGYKLREYQEPPINNIVQYFKSLSWGQCLLQAGTGSGKTYGLAYIISLIGRKTLILSHLTMLGDQILKELTANLSEGTLGVLKATSLGKPLPDIGICSFKLLENKKLLTYVAENYAMVVVDEAENSVTATRLNVLYNLKPQYQLYLTATPTKELVQQTKAVKYLYSEVFTMNPPEESKVHSKHLMVDFQHLKWFSPADPMMYKVSLGKFITHSEILPWVTSLCVELKAAKVEGTIWIIVDLIKVQDQLEKRLVKQGLRVGIIRGDTSKKLRELVLLAIHNRELDVLIGSAPLSAGLSIPELAVGIRLMPNSSSEELLEQQKGRLNRFIDFKEYQPPIWVDFRISGSLEYGAKKRFTAYKKTTLGVVMVKPQDVLSVIHKEILGGSNETNR